MIKININVEKMPGNVEKEVRVLDTKTILRYLIGNDDKLDTLILCKPENVELTTTDKELYEALGSTKQYDNVKLNKLVKLLEVADIHSHKQKSGEDKQILKDEQVENLRKQALLED